MIGRHDPVLLPRAGPVVEAMLHLMLIDFMLLSYGVNPDPLNGNAVKHDSNYHFINPQNDPDDPVIRAKLTED